MMRQIEVIKSFQKKAREFEVLGILPQIQKKNSIFFIINIVVVFQKMSNFAPVAI